MSESISKPKVKGRYYGNKGLVLIGLSEAGKTAWRKRFMYNVYDPQPPTFGLHQSKFEGAGYRVDVTEIGGQTKFEHLKKDAVQKNSIIAFVVDAADHDRFQEVQIEFNRLVRPFYLEKKIIILATKQDLEGAADESTIQQLLNEKQSKIINWQIIETSAKTGKGKQDFLHILRNSALSYSH